MGASLLTCCELLEVAWMYLLQKCCAMFPTAGPAIASVAKFLLPMATDDANIDNVNNTININRRTSDATFPTKINKGSVAIAIQATAEEDGKIETLQNSFVPDHERQNNTRKYKLSHIKSDLNGSSADKKMVSVLYIDGESPQEDNIYVNTPKQCKRRAASCKTMHLKNDKNNGSSTSIDFTPSLRPRGNTLRTIAATPSSVDDGRYKIQRTSCADSRQGHAQSQTPESRISKEDVIDRSLSICSPSESTKTRYLFHHFPPSTEAQKFYRDVANGGESQDNKSVSTSYVHTREVPKSFYCSKSPPSPNLYIVHTATGTSLSKAYLPNGNAISSRSTATSSTSTPTGGSTSHKHNCQKRKSVSNSLSGASTIRSSSDTLNIKKSSRKEKGLHIGSEELIV